jgi:hypothetical protein
MFQRTLSKGLHGLVQGRCGSFSFIYAAADMFGTGDDCQFIEANEAPLQLFGCVILGFFGFYFFRSNPTKVSTGKVTKNYRIPRIFYRLFC